MPDDIRKLATTSNKVRFGLVDKTTGQGKTGLSIATAGLIISTIADNEATATTYTQAGGTLQTIATLGTFAAPSASNCRFKEVDATNHPGLYEFQFLDARFAVASSKRLFISVNDAGSTILDKRYEIQMVSYDPYDVIRMGLTSLSSAVCTGNTSMITSGNGADQLTVTSGTASCSADVVTWDGSAVDPLSTTADIFTAILTTQITESYRATGVAPTVAQALCELIAGVLDHSIVSATKTLRKFDGTTAKTYTLNQAVDASSITSITETT